MKKNIEKEEEKSGTKGLIALLIIIIIGLVGYICYDVGLFNNLFGKDEPKPQEELVEGYSFNFKDVSCQKGENSCTKEMKVSYNSENHMIKVVTEVMENQENATKYTIYLDDKEVYKVDDSGLRLYPGEDMNTYLDIEGYVYIFDKANVAVVLPTYSYKLMFKAFIFNSNNSYIRDFLITGLGFTKGEKDYGSSIDSVEFDGHTLKTWDRDCNNYDNGIQYAITIEKGVVVFKQLQTISNVMTGGQEGCKYENEKIS